MEHTRTTSQHSEQAKAALLSRKDYVVGIALLVVVVILWTSSNFVTQNLFRDDFERPFLVTYMNTSAFSLYLIPFCFRYLKNGANPILYWRRAYYQSLPTDTITAELEDPSSDVSALEDDPPLTMKETYRLALEFCFFWFIANWAVNASLNYTSVASATILTSMSGFFTLGIGRIFRVEYLDFTKVGAVIVSFLGVILVSISDSKTDSDAIINPSTPTHVDSPLFGDLLALISAVCYALYVILLKVRIKSESRVDMQLFFGFVGLFNVLLCWPMIVILDLLGIEKFGLPSTSSQLSSVLINMAITWSSDYIYVLAMLKTTPLVVTVGLSLTIPLAVAGDFFFDRPASVQVVLGALLVLLGFVAVGLRGSEEESRGSRLLENQRNLED